MTNETTSAIDLVGRLRELAEHNRQHFPVTREEGYYALGDEAADTITRLQAALTYIGKTRYGLDTNASDEEASEYWSKLALDYRRKAREALRSSVGGEAASTGDHSPAMTKSV